MASQCWPGTGHHRGSDAAMLSSGIDVPLSPTTTHVPGPQTLPPPPQLTCNNKQPFQ